MEKAKLAIARRKEDAATTSKKDEPGKHEEGANVMPHYFSAIFTNYLFFKNGDFLGN
jgi:hypothetical protein